MKRLIIVGAGGAGSEALLVAARMTWKWEVIGFCDDAPSLKGTALDGVPVLENIDGLVERFGAQGLSFHCAIGHNQARKRIADRLEGAGFHPATLVDPTAVLAQSAVIGAGAYVAPFAFVGPGCRVGRHVLINVSATVGHHCTVGDFVQLCPGARLSGGTILGEGAFVGSNAVTVPLIHIGEWSTLGASSLAARDVPPHVTAIGVPAAVRALAVRPVVPSP